MRIQYLLRKLSLNRSRLLDDLGVAGESSGSASFEFIISCEVSLSDNSAARSSKLISANMSKFTTSNTSFSTFVIKVRLLDIFESRSSIRNHMLCELKS